MSDQGNTPVTNSPLTTERSTCGCVKECDPSLLAGDEVCVNLSAQEPCQDHGAELRLQGSLPCPWCVIDELRSNNATLRSALTASEKLLKEALFIMDECDTPILIGCEWHTALRAILAKGETK